MLHRFILVAAATAVLLAVAPAPALNGGLSVAATAAALLNAAVFFCFAFLQRDVEAAVIVLCGPLFKVTVVAATASSVTAVLTSHAFIQIAAASLLASVFIAVLLLIASAAQQRQQPKDIDTLMCVRNLDVEVERLTEAAHTGLFFCLGVFTTVLAGSTASPLNVPLLSVECTHFVAAVVSATAFPFTFAAIIPHVVFDERSNNSSRKRLAATLSAVLMLLSLLAVIVLTTCDVAPLSASVASAALRRDAVAFLFGRCWSTRCPPAAAADCLAVAVVRVMTMTVVVPLMVASLAAPFRAERELDPRCPDHIANESSVVV